MFHLGRHNGRFQGELFALFGFYQYVGNREIDLVWREKMGSNVCLGIAINEQCLIPAHREFCGYAGRSSAFAHTAFLISNGNRLHPSMRPSSLSPAFQEALIASAQVATDSAPRARNAQSR